MRRIKQNISPSQYRHLQNYLKADESLRSSRRRRLQMTFSLLWNLGLRVNESTQITRKKIAELLTHGETIIFITKTNTNRILYVTESGSKDLKKYFNDIASNEELLIVSERSTKVIDPKSLINDINSYLKIVFPDKSITSHSFRQSLITSLAEANINTGIIQNFIGHKNASSTLRYIKASRGSIVNSLEGIR